MRILRLLFVALKLMYTCLLVNFKFGNRGSLEQHGFARNRLWVFDESPPPLKSSYPSSDAFIDLLLKPTDDDLKIWPHR